MNSIVKAIIEVMEHRSEPQSLFPEKPWNSELERQIEQLKSLGSSTEKITLIAALHLCNDSLDRSHSYAQQIEHDPTGAYWHGIMHRMEQDYWNAKYWFRQAGRQSGTHPVMVQVQQRVEEWLTANWHENRGADQAEVTEAASKESLSEELNKVLRTFQQGGWNSVQYCDLVRMNEELDPEEIALLQHIQAIEVNELLQYTLANVDA